MIINIKGYNVIIDKEDYKKINQFNWTPSNQRGRVYFSMWINSKRVSMHRFLLNAKKGTEIDHKNNNTFDNRKCNLRLCTRTQNRCNSRKQKNNTTGYKGVSYHKTTKKYRAQINNNKKRIHLGYFDDPKKAHEKYCHAAIKYYGEFARA